MSDDIKNVVFLCTGNSARSILAEAILQKEGKGKFNAFSAGSRPKTEPHHAAICLLKNRGFVTAKLRSKSWHEFVASNAIHIDIVITVCDSAAAETCPVWPGKPISAHWSLPDPVAVTGTAEIVEQAFEKTYEKLKTRIRKLLKLPISELDPNELKMEIAKIGQIKD